MLFFHFSLDKKNWQIEDIKEFEKALYTYIGREIEIFREKKIANTKLDCLGISNKIINKIVDLICEGNYQEFLDITSNKNHPYTMVRGKIINKITDFKIFKKYLDDYSNNIDSWAHCDFFNIKIEKLGKINITNLIIEYLNSNNLFRRRIAIILLMKHYLSSSENLRFAFDCVSFLSEEKEFYVYTAIAWLLSESYIKQPTPTLTFLKNSNLNSLIIKKFLSKCKESLRINDESFNKLKFLNN